VVVIDTLAQTTPGADENSAEGMGKALGSCRRIHEATDALVVLIHHSGKDKTRGMRGWSGLPGACDTIFEVTRDGDERTARLEKVKDGEDGAEFNCVFRRNVTGVSDG
jgi:RecA-family ATPase